MIFIFENFHASPIRPNHEPSFSKPKNTTEQRAQCTRHEAKVQYLKVVELHVSRATCYINHERSLTIHTPDSFKRSNWCAGTKNSRRGRIATSPTLPTAQAERYAVCPNPPSFIPKLFSCSAYSVIETLPNCLRRKTSVVSRKSIDYHHIT